MVRTVRENGDCPHAYLQALNDFGITELISHLSNYSDADFNARLMNVEAEELESLAAILIQRLIDRLDGKLIASYLNTVRHGNSEVISDPTTWEIPLPSLDLPASIPQDVIPRYQEGDRVRWRPFGDFGDTTDWGIVVGRFYAKHRCQWTVCYLVKLDRDSPSVAWTVADTAWEEDLEPDADKDGEPWEDTIPNIEVQNPKSPIPNRDMPKFLRTPPGDYNYRHKPRPITQRELNLIELYSNCKLAMTPRQFYSRWSVTHEQLAAICDRTRPTVGRWFSRGRTYLRPTRSDLRHLAIANFLLEHFEKIPPQLLNALCPPDRRR